MMRSAPRTLALLSALVVGTALGVSGLSAPAGTIDDDPTAFASSEVDSTLGRLSETATQITVATDRPSDRAHMRWVKQRVVAALVVMAFAGSMLAGRGHSLTARTERRYHALFERFEPARAPPALPLP